MIPNPHNNASLIMGGFGTVAEGAKPFIEEMRTNQDFDLLSQQAMQLMEQGVSPQEAAARLRGGANGGIQASGGQRPGLTAPQVRVGTPMQPNVVGNVVGPSSPLQDRPQAQAPQAQSILGAPRPAVSGPSILGSPLEMNDPGYAAPQPPPRQPLRPPVQTAPAPVQMAQAAQPQAQPSQLYGVQGRITSRNLPLAQMMSQRLQQRDLASAKQQGALEATQQKATLEREKEQGRNDRALLAAETRANIAAAEIDKALQLGELTNDTNVMRALLGYKAAMLATSERARLGDRNADLRGQMLQMMAPAVKVAAQSLGSARALAGAMPTEENNRRVLEEQARFDALMSLGANLEAKSDIIPGDEQTVTTPGAFGVFPDKTEKKVGPPSAKATPTGGPGVVVSPPKGPAPKPPGQPAQKTVVRTGTNKATGKKVILYSDGTREER